MDTQLLEQPLVHAALNEYFLRSCLSLSQRYILKANHNRIQFAAILQQVVYH